MNLTDDEIAYLHALMDELTRLGMPALVGAAIKNGEITQNLISCRLAEVSLFGYAHHLPAEQAARAVYHAFIESRAMLALPVSSKVM